jgi:hypothetical protein
MINDLQDLFDFVGHLFLQVKRIEGKGLIVPFFLLGLPCGGCIQNFLEGRFGWIICFDYFRSDSDFIDTFHGRDKEIKTEVLL